MLTEFLHWNGQYLQYIVCKQVDTWVLYILYSRISIIRTNWDTVEFGWSKQVMKKKLQILIWLFCKIACMRTFSKEWEDLFKEKIILKKKKSLYTWREEERKIEGSFFIYNSQSRNLREKNYFMCMYCIGIRVLILEIRLIRV